MTLIPLPRPVGMITAIHVRNNGDNAYLAVAGTEMHDQSELWYSVFDLSIEGIIKPIIDMTRVPLRKEETIDTVSPIPEEENTEPAASAAGGRVCAYHGASNGANGQMSFTNQMKMKQTSTKKILQTGNPLVKINKPKTKVSQLQFSYDLGLVALLTNGP